MTHDYVTERELKANLDPIREDIYEIKSDVKCLVADRYQGSWLGGKGQALISTAITAVVAATVTAVAAFVLPSIF